MMKASVCCYLGESGCLPLCYAKLVPLFRVAGFPQLRQHRLLTSGGRKNQHVSLANSFNMVGPRSDIWHHDLY